eukprot:CAMPEP_0113595922 /NCGR_PEP_ID=MMETSP0015_2-20120614/40028_1 /TAXON_ID=2838 /ORGANISM="Odontella" /LENGTH=170 /DNA_ID=CAMNT_0000503337 /DNA_START=24 /DNA_END=533 /DNA_ORIENTATION=- /assembly_acc=CAM_ASM_000160
MADVGFHGAELADKSDPHRCTRHSSSLRNSREARVLGAAGSDLPAPCSGERRRRGGGRGLGFLAFAYARTVGEAPGASQEVLNQFLMDPIHPGVNEIFAVVFNLLGLAPVVLASLIMPSARGQKLPATPFLALSAAAGYTAVGPYMAFRQPAVDVAVKSDLGWFTANVLE